MNSPIVWLASYPRSGNTYLRVLLSDCFGLRVSSKYDEDYSRFPISFAKMLGYFNTKEMGIYKTHEPPDDKNPAIYITRDGRAAVLSYFHYCSDFETRRTIEDIIIGNVPFGSWSDHYRSWNPKQRAETLFLRFEDITTRPEEAVEQIATFLNRRPSGRFERDFESMNMVEPRFFRSGSNQRNIAELNEDQLSMFDEKHGEIMRQLGYYGAVEPGNQSPVTGTVDSDANGQHSIRRKSGSS